MWRLYKLIVLMLVEGRILLVDIFYYVYIFDIKFIRNVLILIGVIDVVLEVGIIGIFISLYWWRIKLFEVSVEMEDSVWGMFF